ncbi:MAG: pterin-binding protein [Anaerolineaceae bacterium 4572_5.1]|nr:MAG: pterin-binding protein [Anaerolinea sp. 4484_236]OQY36010.1 MAG: pterin-binding protein [Anaerolineaceae bacterium 4572_5.1]
MSENQKTILSYKDKKVEISRDLPTVMIGERINPTGRKAVLKALEEGNFDMIREDAIAQVAAGAPVLDVNAGVPSMDEVKLLPQLMQEVLAVVDVPLCIDTANPQALEAALKLYDGKALINSVNGEKKSLKAVLPLAKEHGAAVIALCMDDDGIPATPELRLKVAAKMIERATSMGIPLEDIVVDPLAMTMGADHNAGAITLKTVELVVAEFGVNVTMGASNISFGMPDRKYINSAFIAIAIHAGLTCPITNPLVTEIATAVLASDLSLGRDEYGMSWIKAYRKRKKAQGK